MLAQLHRLGAASSAEFVEKTAGVSLDGVLADEEALGDFAVGEAGGDEAEDFEFAWGDAEGGEAGGVGGERSGGGLGRWGGGLFASEGQAEPDAERGEDNGDQAAVDFEGVLDDEEAVLGEFEEGDEEAAEKAEEDDVAQGAAARFGGRVGGGRRHLEDMIAEKERGVEPGERKSRGEVAALGS